MAGCFPDLYVKLEAALETKDLKGAQEIQAQIASNKVLFDGKPEIVQLKKILASIIGGYPQGVRLPLIE